jgi:prepilin peptidase CpaA
MIFIIWLILFMIAVTDAREHRIPNVLVLLLIGTAILYQWHQSPEWLALLHSVGAGVGLFLIGFIFYLLRAMAPGDVKLLAGVGIFLGWGQLACGGAWIGVSCLFIGGMYLLLSHVQQFQPFSQFVAPFKVRSEQSISCDRHQSYGSYRMPFAPVVVIGLALHSFFGK